MFEHPYSRLLLRVDKPGRYIGGEFGAVAPKDDAAVRLALAFPDVYEIGMSHMGISILYEIVNKLAWASAERVFMPWPDMEAILKEEKVPLVSLESATPLGEFDLLGFSLQYELTYTNVIAMLDLAGIPRRSADRRETDPLVLVGGPVAMQSEPLSPFVDLVLVGDGEEALPALLTKLADCKKKNISREDTIAQLGDMASVYAPGKYQRVIDPISQRMVIDTPSPLCRLAKIPVLEGAPFGNGPVPMIQAVFDRFSVEIARGCTEGCRFCQAGFTYRPVRERSVDDISNAVQRAVACLGFDEASLAALSSADHSQIQSIVTGLGDQFTGQKVSLSVPSLRAYGLSDELVEVLARLRATGVTLAPEAGSQRLRDAVNKNVTEEDLMSAAARFFDHGFTRIKLYFMLGLPGETDEDLAEIVYLAVRLRSLGRRRLGRKSVDIVVSVSTFVPKPFTPFEREPMIDQDEIQRRQWVIKDLARISRIEVKTHDTRLSRLEGIFCRGDASLADILEKAVDGGARFDGWGDMFVEEAWNKALEGVDTNRFTEELPDDGRLPWDHIESGLEAKFLRREREASRSASTTRPCGVFDGVNDDSPVFVCHACGVKCVRGELPVKPPRQKLQPVEERPIPERPKGHPRPKPVVQLSDGEPIKFRFELSVYGRQTFIGHLDTMRHLHRSLRRAGLEMLYTQGFHPKPKIEAAPPLPLGTAGLAEPVDLSLLDPPDDGEILSRLRAAVPPDLEVRSVRRLVPSDKKLAKAYDGANYIAFFKTSKEAAQDAIDRLLSSKTVEVTRTRKGKTKTVEIRQYVLDAKLVDVKGEDVKLPNDPHRVGIAMTLRVPGSGGTKPTEVLSPFLDAVTDEPWVVRTEWVAVKEVVPLMGDAN